MKERLFLDELRDNLGFINVTPIDGFDLVVNHAKSFRSSSQFFFIGNGGSAAIADHMAADWNINGGFAAHSLNNAAGLTCAANDYGVEEMFARQIRDLPRSRYDILFAISSSGKSKNVLNAIDAFRTKDKDLAVVTLSGFEADNPLRQKGNINFYIPAYRYGVVETAHLAILHAILDKVMETKE